MTEVYEGQDFVAEEADPLSTGPETVEFNDCLCVYMGALDAVASLCVVNHLFYAGSLDGSIHAYDLQSGSLIQHLRGHTAAVTALLHYDRHLLSSSRDGTIRIWDIEEGTCVRVLSEHIPHAVLCMALSTKDKLLYAADAQATLRVYDLSRDYAVKSTVAKLHLAQVTSLALLSAHPGHIISGSYDRLAKRTNVTTSAMMQAYISGKSRFGPHHTVKCVAVDDARQTVYVGSSDGKVRGYSLDSAECMVEMVAPVYTQAKSGPAAVLCLAVPPGGQKLYAGYEDGAVRQFDGASGTLEYEFRGHTDGVTTLWVEASMPHPEDPNSVEMVLYSGSYDHSVRCWDLQGTQKYLEYVNAKRAEEERLERERAEEMARLEAEASKGSKKEGKKKKK